MYYALVTGSAKGLGKGFATRLAIRNYNLLLVDMDQPGLEKTASELREKYKVDVQTFAQDLSAPGAITNIKTWSQPWHYQLQVVINNAGFGLNGRFEYLPIEGQLNIVDVNIKATVALCHNFIPILHKMEKGYLLNVGSNAGYQAVPFLTIYAASKAFIISFTRGIRFELKDSNVSVTCLTAGPTESNFMDRAGMEGKVRRTAAKMEVPAIKVAEVGLKALFAGKAEVVPDFNSKLGIFLARHSPKKWSEMYGANIFRKD